MTNQIMKTIREAVKQWWIPLLVGIILIGTAVATFTSPSGSLMALSMLFSIVFLTLGILESAFAIANRKQMDNWGWILAYGILTTLVGGMLIANPEVSMVSLSLFVGFMLMFRSFAAIGWALDLKEYGVIEWGSLMVIAVLGVIFSFILIWNPTFSGMTIVFWTGMAFLAGGIFNIYLGFKMKSMHKNWDTISEEVKTQIDELESLINSEIENAVE